MLIRIKNLANIFLLILFSLIVTACFSEDEDDEETYLMCFEDAGGEVLANCQNQRVSGSCEGGGREQVPGTYKDFSTCFDDTDSVLDNYIATGILSPGPNSSLGSSSDGSGGGSSSSGCTPTIPTCFSHTGRPGNQPGLLVVEVDNNCSEEIFTRVCSNSNDCIDDSIDPGTSWDWRLFGISYTLEQRCE